MTELDLFYNCVIDIAEMIVDLRKKPAEDQEKWKSECLEYVNDFSPFAQEFIRKVLIVIESYL